MGHMFSSVSPNVTKNFESDSSVSEINVVQKMLHRSTSPPTFQNKQPRSTKRLRSKLNVSSSDSIISIIPKMTRKRRKKIRKSIKEVVTEPVITTPIPVIHNPFETSVQPVQESTVPSKPSFHGKPKFIRQNCKPKFSELPYQEQPMYDNLIDELTQKLSRRREMASFIEKQDIARKKCAKHALHGYRTPLRLESWREPSAEFHGKKFRQVRDQFENPGSFIKSAEEIDKELTVQYINSTQEINESGSDESDLKTSKHLDFDHKILFNNEIPTNHSKCTCPTQLPTNHKKSKPGSKYNCLKKCTCGID